MIKFNYQNGGNLQDQDIQLSEVQIEKGEKILLPSLDLVNTAAKKRHSAMDKYLVTDILPQSSYIFSDTKKMKINKNSYLAGQKIGDISLGYEAIDYKENESTPMPKEITFGDLIKKMKFTPAEYADRIASKYPTTEREKDTFATLANQENKESRMPYLQILTQLSELLKAKNQPQGEQGFIQGAPMQQYGGNIYEVGKEYDIPLQEITRLKKLGYKLEY